MNQHKVIRAAQKYRKAAHTTIKAEDKYNQLARATQQALREYDRAKAVEAEVETVLLDTCEESF